jgi:aminopeptidase N
MYRDTPHPTLLKDYLPPEFLIDRVDLHFDLDPETTQVSAAIAFRRNPAALRGGEELRLDGEQLELIAIALDGRPLGLDEYQVTDDALILKRVPDRFELSTRVRIHPILNTALEGLYQSGQMLCTQCEAEGFRRITYYLDRPDVMARFGVTLEADQARYPVLLANGNPGESCVVEGGRHLARWEDPFPKPSYLFALVAGDLAAIEDSFTTASGRAVGLRIYVEPENLDKCAHAMRSLKAAMAWDEAHYGREYDLDLYQIVAVSHFNMGAMENKGLNVFNAKFVLARPDTATDQDYLGIEGVIAHEYFHNWTGNRITCRDWFQLSLKEGFTVYRDQEFSADMGARGVKRINDVRNLRGRQFAEDSGPMAHPVRPDSYIEINNFYTATVYEKGAELVRMQATLLGPEAFRRATDLYFERHDGQAVTTEDFVRCMEDAGGRDLNQFRRWYSQAGTPVIDVEDDYDASTRTFTLTLRQSTPATPGQPDKLPLHIPFALGLLDADGLDLPLRLDGEDRAAQVPAGTRLLELSEAEQSFRFADVPVRPVPSLLRGFSAPVRLRRDWREEDLMFLMAHDSDGFNRWDAAQSLTQRLLLRLVTEPEAQVPAGYMAAFRRALTDTEASPALLAEILSLPGEGYLGDQMAQVDVDGIHRACETLRRAVALELDADLLAVYERNGGASPEAHDLSPAAMGRRALKNLCLGYLMAGQSETARGLTLAQYRGGGNMTDAIAALRLLVDDGDAPGRDVVARDALDSFYDRWSGDALVLDKWFSIQAMSRHPETLQRVSALLGHPAYDSGNPNRVRSLVAVFCTANPVRFHGGDGAGYRFLGDRVLELDPHNPQIASRLLQALARWRRYDPARQGLMRGELERILAAPGLSPDAFEVASKCLT